MPQYCNTRVSPTDRPTHVSWPYRLLICIRRSHAHAHISSRANCNAFKWLFWLSLFDFWPATNELVSSKKSISSRGGSNAATNPSDVFGVQPSIVLLHRPTTSSYYIVLLPGTMAAGHASRLGACSPGKKRTAVRHQTDYRLHQLCLATAPIGVRH